MKVVVSTLKRKTTNIKIGQTVKALDNAIEGSVDSVNVQFGVGTYGVLFAFQLEKEAYTNNFRKKPEHVTHRYRNQIDKGN